VGRAFSGGRRTNPSPETSARDARARAWVYVFECYERKKADAGSAAHSGGEAKGEKDDRTENGARGQPGDPTIAHLTSVRRPRGSS
jgi:hypothetical protein